MPKPKTTVYQKLDRKSKETNPINKVVKYLVAPGPLFSQKLQPRKTRNFFIGLAKEQ